jgi:hypothetical protein
VEEDSGVGILFSCSVLCLARFRGRVGISGTKNGNLGLTSCRRRKDCAALGGKASGAGTRQLRSADVNAIEVLAYGAW